MVRAAKAKPKSASVPESTRPIPAAASTARTETKALTIISLLKAKRGATVAAMMEATGWKAHSIRGFLAGSLRKRHGLHAVSEKVDGEPRRYRLR